MPVSLRWKRFRLGAVQLLPHPATLQCSLFARLPARLSQQGTSVSTPILSYSPVSDLFVKNQACSGVNRLKGHIVSPPSRPCIHPPIKQNHMLKAIWSCIVGGSTLLEFMVLLTLAKHWMRLGAARSLVFLSLRFWGQTLVMSQWWFSYISNIKVHLI